MTSEIERLTAENERLNEHLDKLQSLLSGAMFDIRNPMYMISAASDFMLESNDLSLEDTNKILEMINKNACRVSDYLGVLQGLQHGGIHKHGQIEKYLVGELIEIIEKMPDSLSNKGSCKIDLASSFNFSENDYVQLPFLSFRHGAGLIIEQLIEMSSKDHIHINFFHKKDLLQIEFATETDKKTQNNINLESSYSYRFTVVELIFELYGGVLRTETRKGQIVSILELPMGKIEEADAE